jgi:4-hydroxythreonine-4-phosphate dehydrogenase
MAGDDRPLIAITLGDVAGIGPEVAVRAWTVPALHAAARTVVVGSIAVLEKAKRLCGLSEIRIEAVHRPADGHSSPSLLPCVELPDSRLDAVLPGRVDARAGMAAYQALATAIDLALEGQIDAITTLPLNKEGLRAAGLAYPGHTEILAERCGVDQFAMMLYVGNPPAKGPGGLGVVHATLHVSLAQALALLTRDRVLRTIQLADEALRPFLNRGRPRIAVAGLNPHAGEHGLFGDEEERFIAPAVQLACARGLEVYGPIAADTLFRRAFAGDFDAVVAMYHDQGHVAVKSVAFWEAVNITLGLPIIRTSVAHGTAYDIAWQGKSRPDSLIAAVQAASQLARARTNLKA